MEYSLTVRPEHISAFKCHDHDCHVIETSRDLWGWGVGEAVERELFHHLPADYTPHEAIHTLQYLVRARTQSGWCVGRWRFGDCEQGCWVHVGMALTLHVSLLTATTCSQFREATKRVSVERDLSYYLLLRSGLGSLSLTLSEQLS